MRTDEEVLEIAFRDIGDISDLTVLDAGMEGIASKYLPERIGDGRIIGVNVWLDAYSKVRERLGDKLTEKVVFIQARNLGAKDTIDTETAKKIAEERHKFVEQFLERLLKEWEGKRSSFTAIDLLKGSLSLTILQMEERMGCTEWVNPLRSWTGGLFTSDLFCDQTLIASAHGMAIQVTRFLAMKPLSRAEAKRMFEHLLDDSNGVYFGVIKKGEERPIGYVFLAHISRSHKVARELGIVIGEESLWGHGYGSEAAKLMLEYGFKQLGLHRIELLVLDFNQRARNMYGKLGFVEEGVLREARLVDRRWRDVIMMGMLESEFGK